MTLLERKPTTRTRLEDESGWTITGGSVRWASRPCLGQPLLDHLPGFEEVGARLEDQRDGGQPVHGLRADTVEERHPVEQQVLHRSGDQLLDLLRRQAQRLGLHLDVRRRELRERVGLGLPGLQHTEHDKPGGNCQYERTSGDGTRDQPRSIDVDLLVLGQRDDLAPSDLEVHSDGHPDPLEGSTVPTPSSA